MEHHWSGWPGAYCLNCGISDPREVDPDDLSIVMPPCRVVTNEDLAKMGAALKSGDQDAAVEIIIEVAARDKAQRIRSL